MDESEFHSAERMCSCRDNGFALAGVRPWSLVELDMRDWYSTVTELAPNGFDTPILTGRLEVSAAWASASTASQENEVRVSLREKEKRT